MRRLGFLLVSLVFGCAIWAQEKLGPGRSTIEFADPAALDGRPLPVHLFAPKRVAARTPVLFVIHGQSRGALDYRETWMPLAKKHDLLLVCPEFTDASFPGSAAFNCGQVEQRADDEERWTFRVVERLFDRVRELAGTEVERYLLYGHSAGAQFVHRLVLLLPEARLERAVAANAGWYTFPDAARVYPYGLEGVPAFEPRLCTALGRELVVLLGEEDTDTADPDLRTTPEAMAQGAHRLARGQAFFAAGQLAAEGRDLAFAWRLETVRGAGHSNSAMARAALDALLAPSRPRR